MPIGDFDRTPLRCLQSALLLALDLRVRWLEEPCVVGVTNTDLFASVFTFVFGEARLEGRVAVVSLHRLRPEHYGFAADPIALQDRLAKEVLHEVGHLFGLVHCHHPECVMGFSAVVEEIDNKGFDFCDDCLTFVDERRHRQGESGRPE